MTIDERLDRIESLLLSLVEKERVRSGIRSRNSRGSSDAPPSPAGSGAATVASWRRKRKAVEGAHAAWAISDAELLRFQREGLLPKRSA